MNPSSQLPAAHRQSVGVSMFQRFSILIFALLLLVLTPGARAVDLYWDSNGATSGTGGAGNWLTSNSSIPWRNGSSSGTLQAWADGNNVILGGTLGAVTITSGNTITLPKISVATTGYSLSGGTVAFGGSAAAPGIIDVNTINSFSFSSGATGSLKVNATGNTATLTSATLLTISGGTTLTSFELALALDSNPIILGHAAALGSASSQVKLTKGILMLGNASTDNFSFNAWPTELAGGTIRARFGVETWNGATTLSANSQIMTRSENPTAVPKLVFSSTATINLNANTLNVMPSLLSQGIELNGAISGAGNLAFVNNVLGGGDTGTGTCKLGAANDFSGTATTTLNLGTLALNNVNALQNATLDTAASGSQAVTFIVAGNNTYNIGALTGSDALAIGANTISVGSKTVDTAFSGIISGGSGILTKVGNNKLTLSGPNTFNGGVNINAGVLQANATETPGTSGPLGASGTISFGGGTLQYSAANAADYSARISTAGSQAYKVDVNGQTVAFASALQGSGSTLTVSDTAGAGKLTLSAANSYSGNTAINGGTLALGASASLDSASSVSVAAGATFDVSAIGTYTWGGSASLTASGSTVAAATLKGGTTVSLNGRPVTLNFTPTGFLGDSTHPALTMSAGALDLSGSTVTVVNNAGSPLGAGDYTIVSGGNLTGTLSTLDTTTGVGFGTGLAASTTANLAFIGGNLILQVVTSLPATTTTLALNGGFSSPSTYGDALQFDVTVAGSASPGGTVTLKDGGSAGTTIGSGTLSGGSVTITLNPLNGLSATTHNNIVAVYLGDVNNAGSVSSPLTQVVQTKALTISSPAAKSKLYDGATAAVITGTLSGVVSGDTVTFNGTGDYSPDASVGNGKTVNSTATLNQSGANYTLTQPSGLTADIINQATWTATGGGSWDTAGNWQSSIIGTGSGQTADFNTLNLTADTTVSLNSPRTIGNLTFGDTDITAGSEASWTLNNNSTPANILTLAGTTPTVTVNALGAGKNTTISAVVAGTSGMTKAGNGTLVLSGANTYAGSTAVSVGTVQLGASGTSTTSCPLGTSADGTVVTAGATLDCNGYKAYAEPITISGTGVGANGALINTRADQINAVQTLTLANNASVGGTFRFDLRQNSARPALNLAGYTLTKTGANTLALVDTLVTPGAGNIDVAQGIFSIQTTTAMGGSSANRIYVRNTATLETYQGGTWTAPTWTVEMDAGSSFTSANLITAWAGPVTLNGAANIGGSATLNLNGAITGPSGSLNKNGSGTLILGSTAGANTYGGTTTITCTPSVSTTLQLGANDQIPDGSVVTFTGGVSGNSGASYLTLSGYTETVAGISDSTTRGVIQNEQTGSGRPATTLTVNNSSSDYSFNGFFRDYSAVGTGAGALGLTKQGGSKLTLSGANVTYTGPTTISGGTLTLTDTTAFNSAITDDSVLELNRSSSTWTLTKAISGTGSLTKSGGGTVTLSPAAGNSYQNGTAINAGVLALGTAGAIGTVGSISFGGGTLQFSAADTTDYSARFSSANNQAYKLDVPTSLAVTLANGLNSSGGTFTKSGAGTLTLSVPDGYDGATTVSVGALNIQNAGALGTAAGDTTVTSGARLEVQNNIIVTSEPVTVNGNGGNFFGGLQGVSGVNEWQGPVTIGATSGTRIGVNAGTFIISGPIGGSTAPNGIMFRPNTGSLVLSSANNYAGDTTIICSGGIVQLAGGANRLPIGTKLIFGGTAVSGILDLNGQNQEVAGLSVASGTANWVTNGLATTATFTVNTPSGSPSTYSSGGNVCGAVQLVKSGLDTLTLQGANTYTGNTTISAGTLALSGSGSLASLNMAIDPGATFDVSAVTPGNFSLNGSGSLSLSLNKSGLTLTQGQLAIGAKTLNYGGSLTVVSNANSEAFASGNSFTLVTTNTGATFSGWFSSVGLPPLNSGLSWDTNNLATAGVLDVYSFTTTALPLWTPTNAPATISAFKLANHVSSSKLATAYPATGWSASATTPANGGSVVVNGNGSLTYTPAGAANVNGGTDSFTVTFYDGHGWQTMAVTIAVGTSSSGGQSPNVLTSGTDGSGNFYTLFAGLPNTTYTVETNSVISGGTWVKYGANYSTGADGLLNVTNVPPVSGSLFFRTVYPSY